MIIHEIVSNGTREMHPNWEAMTVLRTKEGCRFQTGFVERGEKGNHIDGTKKPGPWAYTFRLCISITSDPEQSSGADSRRRREAGTEIEVDSGDLLRIDGEFYEVETFRRGEFINLHRVEVTATRIDG